jgi:hypothetical protein
MSSEDDTVAVPVPVGLLKKWEQSADRREDLYEAAEEMRSFIPKPKPKPRLVAVDLEFPDHLDIAEMQRFVGKHELAGEPGASQVGALLSRLSHSSDLLTVLDGVIDECEAYASTNGPHSLIEASEAKRAIRKALGVPDAE